MKVANSRKGGTFKILCEFGGGREDLHLAGRGKKGVNVFKSNINEVQAGQPSGH